MTKRVPNRPPRGYNSRWRKEAKGKPNVEGSDDEQAVEIR